MFKKLTQKWSNKISYQVRMNLDNVITYAQDMLNRQNRLYTSYKTTQDASDFVDYMIVKVRFKMGLIAYKFKMNLFFAERTVVDFLA